MTRTIVTCLLFLFLWVGIAEAQDEHRSREAALFLTDATDILTDDDALTTDDFQVAHQLIDALETNRQSDVAESFVASVGDEELRRKLYTSLFRCRIDQWLEKASDIGSIDEMLSEDQLGTLKKFVVEGEVYDILSDVDRFERLMSADGFQLVDELARCVAVDLQNYRFQEGSYGQQYNLLWLYSRAASQHLRNGSMASLDAANELFSRFGLPETRDDARIFAIRDCVRKGRVNVEVAEALLEEIETKHKKFVAAFRLGAYYAGVDDLEGAEKCREIMKLLFDDANERYQSFLLPLQAEIARIRICQGLSAANELQYVRAADRRGAWPDKIDCLLAIAGNVSPKGGDPGHLYRSISLMLDISNQRYDRYSLLKYFDVEDRIETAIQMAEHLPNAHLRASALCQIAGVISGHKTEEMFGGTRDIQYKADRPRAKKLLDTAFQLTKDDETSAIFSTFRDVTVDRSWSMDSIARGYARAGYLQKAVDAARYVSTEDLKGKDVMGRVYSARDNVLMRICECDSQRPFQENDGQEIFDFLAALEELDEKGLHFRLGDLCKGFLDLEMEVRAIDVFRYAQDHLKGVTDFPDSVAWSLAKQGDLERIRNWYGKCEPVIQQRMLVNLCRGFNQQRLAPPRGVIDFIDMRIEDRSKLPFRQCLLTSCWVNDQRAKAEELLLAMIQAAREDEDLEWVVYETAALATALELPELAMRLVPGLVSRGRASLIGLRAGWWMASQKRHKEIEQQTRDHSGLVRAATAIGASRCLLDLPR